MPSVTVRNALEKLRISGPDNRPLLLDLFCGAGGAAMGYYRAGFWPVGVDIRPQPHYPFTFVQANALEFLEYAPLNGVRFIHASPVCKAHSSATPSWARDNHSDMITPMRPQLDKTRLPYVIENVPRAPLSPHLRICGCVVGLTELERERWFECSGWDYTGLMMRPPCTRWVQPVTVAGHGEPAGLRRKRAVSVHGHGGALPGNPNALQRKRTAGVYGRGADHRPGHEARAANVADWRRARDELAQAIPPAYTELIGRQLIAQL